MAEIKLREYQKEALSLAIKIKKNLLCMKPRAGKCQPLYSKVLTPTGWVTMGSIKKGEYVVGSNGNPCEVLEIFPQGTKDIYRVYFSDNTYADCSNDHLWYVKTRYERTHNKNGALRTIDDIKNDLHIGKEKRNKYSIPFIKPVNFTKQSNEINPYLLGTLLGDGGLSIENRIIFSNSEEDIIKKINNILITNYDIRLKHIQNYDYLLLSGNKKNILLQQLKKLGLMGCHSYNKYIPSTYIFTSTEDRLELLRGLIDTDGYVSSRNRQEIEYYTTSKILADNVEDLVRSLGGYASTSTKMGKYGKKETRMCYTVRIRFCNGIIAFSSVKHSSKASNNFKILDKFITNIEYIGKEECKCIYINSEDHLYITDGYNLTHNTIISIFQIRYLINKKLCDKAVIAVTKTATVPFIKDFSRVAKIDLKLIENFEDYLRFLESDTEKVCMIKHSFFEKLGYNQNNIDDVDKQLKDKPRNMLLIIDEAHKMNNIESIAHQAFDNIRHTFDRITLLTATPYSSCLTQLYGLVHLIYPHLWKSKRAFKDDHVEEKDIRDWKTGKYLRPETVRYMNLAMLREKIKPFTYFYFPKLSLNFIQHSVELTNYEEYDRICLGVLTEEDLKE